MGIYRMKRDLDVRQSAPVPDRFHRAQHGPAVPKPNRTELCSSPTEVVSSLAQLNKRKMRDRFKVSEYGSRPLKNDQDVRHPRPRLGTTGTDYGYSWRTLATPTKKKKGLRVCRCPRAASGRNRHSRDERSERAMPSRRTCLAQARAKHEANLRGLLARLHDPVLAGRPLAPGEPYRATSLMLRWTL